MPELPEVEVLVRHLRPALTGKAVRQMWRAHPPHCAGGAEHCIAKKTDETI